MARKEIVVLLDDLDNQEDATVKTCRFGWEGINYEIDLRDANFEKLAKALEPFRAAARVVKQTTGKAQAKPPTLAERSAYNQRVREFAKATGKEVSERGRVPQPLIEAYEAAGGDAGYRPPAPKVDVPQQEMSEVAQAAEAIKEFRNGAPAKKAAAKKAATPKKATAGKEK